jgi:polysaccharide pyruvyl transferase WcaK-like protein
MPTALLAGAFGQRNPGDEGLLDAFVAALDGWDVVATSSTPEWQNGTTASVSSSDPSRIARRVAACDAVVFGGGTVFKELSPATGRPPLDLLQKGLALAYGAKALGKPLAMVGVGAAPISAARGRLVARRLVRQADLLILRDEESADVLAEAGAPTPFRIGADAAWTILGDPAVRGGHGDRVVVALSHEAASGRGEHFAGDIAASLVPLLASGYSVALQPWQVGGPVRPDDLDLARAVRQQLGGAAELLLPPADLHEARATFAGARLVIGLRFHALVAAAAAGTPFIAFAHEPKLAAVARRLAQPAVTPDMTAEAIAHAVCAAARHPVPPSVAAVRAELARAEDGMRLLRLLLADGQSDEADLIGALPLRPTEWTA